MTTQNVPEALTLAACVNTLRLNLWRWVWPVCCLVPVPTTVSPRRFTRRSTNVHGITRMLPLSVRRLTSRRWMRRRAPARSFLPSMTVNMSLARISAVRSPMSPAAFLCRLWLALWSVSCCRLTGITRSLCLPLTRPTRRFARAGYRLMAMCLTAIYANATTGLVRPSLNPSQPSPVP